FDRLQNDAIADVADVVDPTLRGCVHLDHVERRPARDGDAGVARAVGGGGRPVLAVDRLREDPRERRLAGAARAREEVRLPYLPLLDRVRERAHDRLLPHDLREGLRTVLPVEGGHGPILAQGLYVAAARKGGPGSDASSAWLAFASGSRSSKTAPPPGAFRAVHVPSWARAIAATIDRPRPAPPSRRERETSARAKRSKIRSRTAGSIPRPPSATAITTSCGSPRADSSIRSYSAVCCTAFSSSASSAARSHISSTSRTTSTTGPRRHARGATSAHRISTSSTSATSGTCARSTHSSRSARARRRIRSTRRSTRVSSSSTTAISRWSPIRRVSSSR